MQLTLLQQNLRQMEAKIRKTIFLINTKTVRCLSTVGQSSRYCFPSVFHHLGSIYTHLLFQRLFKTHLYDLLRLYYTVHMFAHVAIYALVKINNLNGGMQNSLFLNQTKYCDHSFALSLNDD